MSNYIDIRSMDLEFKNIITGPAPVGRILNYVKLIGEGKLKHKNGNRNLNLFDGIGSAWATEFLLGLGLATYDKNSTSTSVLMYLTSNGRNLYETIKNISFDFDENPDVNLCRSQLLSLGDKPISVFENAFRESVVFQNLKLFLDENGYRQYFKNNTFIDNYFETFKLFYEGGSYDRNVRTTAGQNRVPSLLQLCLFFDYLSIQSDYGIFDLTAKYFKNDEHTIIDYSKEIESLKSENDKDLIVVVELEKKYGIDGTTLRELLLRNSRVQDIFRHNLTIEFGGKCAVCGKDLPDLLVASHIKPSSISNVYEKIDNNNGILLCANHDKLFDHYLITFDFNDGRIIVADVVKKKLDDYQIVDNFKLEKKFLTEKRKDFLVTHNLEFYSKNRG